MLPDTQVKPGVPTAHLSWIGNYIVDRWAGQENVKVVHLGDHWDMPSLSSYDKGKRSMEGRRVLADIAAGNEGFAVLNEPFESYNAKQRAAKHATWNPEKHLLRGNHEHRIQRAIEDDAQVEGCCPTTCCSRLAGRFTTSWRSSTSTAWYSHFFQAAGTGRPLGGTAMNRLVKLGNSFTQGHQQTYDPCCPLPARRSPAARPRRRCVLPAHRGLPGLPGQRALARHRRQSIRSRRRLRPHGGLAGLPVPSLRGQAAGRLDEGAGPPRGARSDGRCGERPRPPRLVPPAPRVDHEDILDHAAREHPDLLECPCRPSSSRTCSPASRPTPTSSTTTATSSSWTRPRQVRRDRGTRHPDRRRAAHDESDTCICGPSSEPVTRDDGSVGWVVVHHSLDAREQKGGPAPMSPPTRCPSSRRCVMTNLDLDAIEARANAATDGPWLGYDERSDLREENPDVNPMWVVAHMEPDGVNWVRDIADIGGGEQDEADAEFIAHARTDVPALVAAPRGPRQGRSLGGGLPVRPGLPRLPR